MLMESQNKKEACGFDVLLMKICRCGRGGVAGRVVGGEVKLVLSHWSEWKNGVYWTCVGKVVSTPVGLRDVRVTRRRAGESRYPPHSGYGIEYPNYPQLGAHRKWCR